MSRDYNLLSAVKIYRRYRRMLSSSNASQNDYRLVLIFAVIQLRRCCREFQIDTIRQQHLSAYDTENDMA